MNKLDQAGIKIVKLLKAKKFQAFYVGGVVRNNMLERESNNLDIATDALPEEVEKILNHAGIKTKPVGKKFGTILAVANSFPIEITTFRQEGFYSDKRHPDQVRFIKDYLDDAKRRDFTINALYFDPLTKQTFDPTNGLKDLKSKIIRFVGDPKKRIDEDALRMLRAVRLSTQLKFKLEKNTFAAIKTRAKYIQKVSAERIKNELDKILLSDNVTDGIRLLQEAGLLKFISPELDGLKNIFHKSKHYHLEGSVFEHTLLVVDNLSISNLDLRYAALFHDVGKINTAKKVFKNNEWVNSFKGHVQESEKIFSKFALQFKFPRLSTNLIRWLIKYHDSKTEFLLMSKTKQIVAVFNKNHDLLADLWAADIKGNVRTDAGDSYQAPHWQAVIEARKLLEQVLIKEKLISKLANGNLISKLSNLKPGIQLGKKIEDVKVKIVLDEIKNEKDLKNYIKST